MDKQAQDKLWNELSEESKKRIDIEYKESMDGSDLKRSIDYLFGSHNLNPKPPTPKTWEDVEEHYTHIDIELDKATKSLCDYSHCSIQLLRKCIATLKIAKLIELSYGGMVSEEEWCNNDIEKWGVVWRPRSNTFSILSYENNIHFIAFHTRQQAEEFMSYESNRKLVEQYYMM